ncbi:hypothetical protein GCM10008939_28370 [Deinococcus aquiradiocola]|uniref:Uncharacterized protein n=1 Tax=Deinococcus aquiradiocola TaxID=393059 RepID=A0A917USY7_9DEIO|nr:hypothetical protein GCM10008939_28370 [Deinococcus aquiradiocola]
MSSLEATLHFQYRASTGRQGRASPRVQSHGEHDDGRNRTDEVWLEAGGQTWHVSEAVTTDD